MPRCSPLSERCTKLQRADARVGDRSSGAASQPLPTATTRWPLRPMLSRLPLALGFLSEEVLDAAAACLDRSWALMSSRKASLNSSRPFLIMAFISRRTSSSDAKECDPCLNGCARSGGTDGWLVEALSRRLLGGARSTWMLPPFAVDSPISSWPIQQLCLRALSWATSSWSTGGPALGEALAASAGPAGPRKKPGAPSGSAAHCAPTLGTRALEVLAIRLEARVLASVPGREP